MKFPDVFVPMGAKTPFFFLILLLTPLFCAPGDDATAFRALLAAADLATNHLMVYTTERFDPAGKLLSTSTNRAAYSREPFLLTGRRSQLPDTVTIFTSNAAWERLDDQGFNLGDLKHRKPDA